MAKFSTEQIKEDTKKIIQSRNYSPLTEGELAKRLQIPVPQRKYFKAVLAELVEEGVLRCEKGRFEKGHASIEGTVTGVISVHRRGFGFVTPLASAALKEEIFIPKDEIGGAIHGDTVVVLPRQSLRKSGYEGQVLEVLQRAREELVGTVTEVLKKSVVVHVPLLGQETLMRAKSAGHEVQIGSRVVLKVLEWGESADEVRGEITSILGHVDDSNTDIPFAIRENLLRHRFPPSALREAREFGSQVPEAEIRNRRDLRDLESITIDPASAKDFDDALHLSRDAKGNYQLAVHIADVAHYVTRDSALNTEAQLRCNSTYFPGRCVPMLPPALSDQLCSLQPNVDRLAVSVFMRFDQQGALVHYDIARSVIRSRKRFSYEEVREVLDGKRPSPFAPMLQEMVGLCGLLKIQRRERGAIEFALPDISIEVDRRGHPKGARRVEYDITHQMVEEFMLKTNELVATHLTRLGRPVAYRIHDVPAEENLQQFRQLATAFGFFLPPSPEAQDLQRLFDQALQTPYGDYLAVAYIRSMKLAAYSPDNIGHYGLSLEHYCHFTSPIRRYADLVVHRILLEDGYTQEELEGIAKTCSDRERVSSRAEESVVRLKKLRLLKQWNGEEQHREYEAVVTRVTGAGMSFELVDLMLEGFLHVSQFDRDYYTFNEREQTWRGEESGRTFSCGTKIQVGVTRIDLVFSEASWYLVVENRRQDRPLRRANRRRY